MQIGPGYAGETPSLHDASEALAAASCFVSNGERRRLAGSALTAMQVQMTGVFCPMPGRSLLTAHDAEQ